MKNTVQRTLESDMQTPKGRTVPDPDVWDMFSNIAHAVEQNTEAINTLRSEIVNVKVDSIQVKQLLMSLPRIEQGLDSIRGKKCDCSGNVSWKMFNPLTWFHP